MVSCDPTVSLQEQGLRLILFSLPHCRAENRAGLPGHNPMVMPKVLACLELVPVTSLCLQNEATKGPCAHCSGPPGLWSPRPSSAWGPQCLALPPLCLHSSKPHVPSSETNSNMTVSPAPLLYALPPPSSALQPLVHITGPSPLPSRWEFLYLCYSSHSLRCLELRGWTL